MLKYFKRAGYLVKVAGTNDCLHEDSLPESIDDRLCAASWSPEKRLKK